MIFHKLNQPAKIGLPPVFIHLYWDFPLEIIQLSGYPHWKPPHQLRPGNPAAC